MVRVYVVGYASMVYLSATVVQGSGGRVLLPSSSDRRLLALKLDDLAFSCGASLQDLDFPAPLNEVFVRSVNCFDPIEKLYYSAGYEPIYLYCAGQVDTATESTSYYPQCIHCSSKPQVSRK